MKILEYAYGNECRTVLYIGNEFSPDPLDMLQRIQGSKKGSSTKEPFAKRVDVQTRNLEEYNNTDADIKKLLAKNGYVEYNPHIVNLQ
mgnify:CR=1 FL=1